MYRAVNNLTLIANPFRIVSAFTRSLMMVGLGLITLSPAGAQGLEAQSQPPPPVHTTTLPPAIIPPMNQPGQSFFEPNVGNLDLGPNLDYNKLNAQRQGLLNQATNGPSTRSNVQTRSAGGAGYFYRNYPWNWSLGDSNYFAVSLNSDIYLYAEPNYLYAYGYASADGAILGHNFNIANATAWGYSTGGYFGGGLTLNVVGYNIIDWYTYQPVSWWYSWYNEEEIAEHYHVWIGPIPVGGRIGVRGTVGSSLSLGLYGTQLTGGIDPYVGLDGFAEAGVDIWFASAGAGVDLTFLACDFPNWCGMFLSADANGNPQLTEYTYSAINLNALSGYFYLYAELFGDYNYWTLWNWTGVQYYNTLYWDWQTIPL